MSSGVQIPYNYGNPSVAKQFFNDLSSNFRSSGFQFGDMKDPPTSFQNFPSTSAQSVPSFVIDDQRYQELHVGVSEANAPGQAEVPFEVEDDVAPVTDDMASTELGTGLMAEGVEAETADISGAIGSVAAYGVAEYQKQSDIAKDVLGKGVAGPTWAAGFQASVDSAHDSKVGMENVLGITAASELGGTYGTILGLGASAVNSLVNTSPEATVMTNTGDDLPVSNLL